MAKITIYCDGGCRGNGKENSIGGFGAKLEWNGMVKELIGGMKNTTNNITELRACIESLKYLKGVDSITPIEIYSDSAYVCNCINNKWHVGWVKNGWRNSKKEPVANKEHWEELLALLNNKNVTFIKVKGHSENVGNARADVLANIAMNIVSETNENLSTNVLTI